MDYSRKPCKLETIAPTSHILCPLNAALWAANHSREAEDSV